jgi:HEAT repeat protein
MRRRATIPLCLALAVAAAVAPPALAAPPSPEPEPKPRPLPSPGAGSPLAETPGARLEAGGVLRFVDEHGAEQARVTLPLPPDAAAPRLRVLDVQGHRVAHLVARLRGAQHIEAVVDAAGPRVLTVERTGPDKDGDRAVELRVDERGVVRYQTSPTLRRCDGDTMMFPEAWSFARNLFWPVIDPPPRGTPLLASASAPPELAGEPLGVYRFVAESTAPDADRRADRLAAPVELEDGRADTLWRAGASGRGEGQWVAARAEGAGHAVRAVRVVPGPGAPPELTLLAGDAVYSVAVAARGTFWIVLPKPIDAACVALVIARPAPSGATELAEVAIYSELDGEGGLERLIAQVAEARVGVGADAAAHVLVQLGGRAADAVAARLPTAHGAGHRRLVEVLARIARDRDAPALAGALETAAPDERAPLVAALAHLGAAGVAQAARVYADESQAPEARADAAQVLALRAAARDGGGPAEALRALVDGAGHGPPAVRVDAVTALGRAVAASPEVRDAVADALAAAATATPPDGARLGDLGRALGAARGAPAALAGGREKAVAALVAALEHAPDADTKLRLVRALGALGEPAAAPTLERAYASASDDEILRWAAARALTQLPGDAGRATLERAVVDADPRVRRAALDGLARSLDADAEARVLTALRGDDWPFVRRAAAETLAAACTRASPSPPASAPASATVASPSAAVAGALARAVVGDPAGRGADPSEEVRRGALVALGRCAPASPAVEAALRSRSQPYAVRELAAAQLAARGGPAAARALAQTLDDVLADPAADERTAGLAAACARSLGRADDRSQPVLDALGAAATEPLSPSVRAAAIEAIARLCPAGAHAALARAAEDPDGTVRKAAGEAARHCRR